MNTVLDKYPSHRDLGGMEIGDELNPSRVPRPKVHVVKGDLVCRLDLPDQRWVIGIEVLLDTGCEITLISDSKVKELEDLRKLDLHAERKVMVRGKHRAAYDLAFVLPGGYPCTAPYGFVAVPKDEFGNVLDASEMLLGQDVMNQLVVTFDGPNGTVTICTP